MMTKFDATILNQPEQFRDIFCRTSTAFMDFKRHTCSLDDLLESLDESIEDFDFEAWVTMAQSKRGKQPSMVQMYENMKEVLEMSYDLEQQLQSNCQELLQMFLACSKEKQQELLGFVVQLATAQVERFIVVFFELLEDKWFYIDSEELEELYQTDEFPVADTIEEYGLAAQRFLNCLGAKETVEMASLSD